MKGDVRRLDADVRGLFIHLEESRFGFTGLTEQFGEVKRLMPDAVTERAALEEIMLAHVGGGK